MTSKRRTFLKTLPAGVFGSSLWLNSCKEPQKETQYIQNKLDNVLSEPVLKSNLFKNPVIIESLELLHFQGNFLCRVRSSEGEEGISVANNYQMRHFYPVFVNRLQPFFIGKDARRWEELLDEVYVYKSNYKVQNLALWVPLATIEFAVLDMLGRMAGKSIGELFGQVCHPEIGVYRANNFRGKSAEESIELIKEHVESSNAKALKFKVGGRMNALEKPTGRSEKLIPLVRATFGENMTIYADSNGSYNVQEAIRIGKIMEEYKIDFYEEPVPFDWYEETIQVANALKVPIAGGEQEASLRNFRWLIANNAIDIVQPDIFYFGGMVRSMKVARMAAAMGKHCVPHISGSGLGYLYMMHFVSAVKNAGPYHEFKGFNNSIPIECPTSDLTSHEGKIKVPTGFGSGVTIDPEFVDKHEVVRVL